MQMTILDVESGRHSSFPINSRQLTIGSDDENDLILSDIALHQVKITSDHNNLFVTNLDGSKTVSIADRTLQTNIPWVWASGQDLRLGSRFVLYHSGISTEERARQTYGGMWLSSALIVMLISFLVIGFNQVLNGTSSRIRRILLTPAATITSISPGTAAVTETTSTPEITLTLLAPTMMPIIAPRQAYTVDIPASVISATQEALASAGNVSDTTGATATPTVVFEDSPLLPEVWAGDTLQPNLLQALEVDFVPARMVRGQPFWHLQKVVWLNEVASNGRHHIYVDVRDKNNNRLTDKKVVVTWDNGNCVRSTVERATEFDKPWSDYGADCAMFSAGRAYSVWIFGAPSDRLDGLGLGVPGVRDQPFLTSYLLIFQEAVVP